MIPYIEPNPIPVWGPIAIEPFGLLVVTGCVAGYFVARWHAATIGLDRHELRAMVAWVLVPGFFLSYWTSLLVDAPEELLRRPLSFWRSMSSYGGFLGGALGAAAYLKSRKLPSWGYADSLVLGLTTGWFFGRLGCSLVHDHLGLRSEFLLAVRFPDGPRHDLGFYEWLVTIGLLAVAFAIRRRRPPQGALVGIVATVYAPVRFMLEFLRVGDLRYLGLTVAQFFSLALLATGLWILRRVVRLRVE